MMFEQSVLEPIEKRVELQLKQPYSIGPYNVVQEGKQWIRLTEGYCPHKCVWCGEKTVKEARTYPIPPIESNDVSLLDMNLLSAPTVAEILKAMSEIRYNGKVVRYHALCGFDYRLLTEELAYLIKEARFYSPKLAWDRHPDQAPKIKKAIQLFEDVGYRRRNIMVFVLANHPFYSFRQCVSKMLCLATLGVMVDPCVFDKQIKPPWKPIGWTVPEIEEFQRLTRKLNMIVRHGGVDPEAFETASKGQTE